jgi:NAD(P)H-hydrate repair Nnr-like enzyme with NAD(P)H-hydrate dehydratase domain
MMLIVGTIPDKKLPLIRGKVSRSGDYLVVNGHQIPRFQGTSAMISAALEVTEYFGIKEPEALLAGDIGSGEGTRAIFQFLTENINNLCPKVMTLHYCLPIITLMRRLFDAIGDRNRPFLIADAGAMYAVKAAGLAPVFDLMTPDPSEVAFLADPNAHHPAYVSEYLFSSDSSLIPEQIKSAFIHKTAARMLLVKGKTDYIAKDGGVLAIINEPDVPALEAIGGTGDTITGLVSAFIYAGFQPVKAATLAAKANRIAGQSLRVTPATKVKDMIDHFKHVFKPLLDNSEDLVTLKTKS